MPQTEWLDLSIDASGSVAGIGGGRDQRRTAVWRTALPSGRLAAEAAGRRMTLLDEPVA